MAGLLQLRKPSKKSRVFCHIYPFSKIYSFNRGIKEEKPPKEDDDMFGNEEHDEAFHDMDCDDLLGQVCMNFSDIF